MRLLPISPIRAEAVVGRRLLDDAFFEQTVRDTQAIILDGVKPQ
jgi:hypothetical protein